MLGRGNWPFSLLCRVATQFLWQIFQKKTHRGLLGPKGSLCAKYEIFKKIQVSGVAELTDFSTVFAKTRNKKIPGNSYQAVCFTAYIRRKSEYI